MLTEGFRDRRRGAGTARLGRGRRRNNTLQLNTGRPAAPENYLDRGAGLSEVVVSVSEKVRLVRVLEPQIGQRLDNFLIRRLKGVPRSRVYRLIRRGEVRVNKKRCKPERKLELGDEVRIPPFTGASVATPAKVNPGLHDFLLRSLLYEDDQLLVINKPPGLAVHGGSGIRLGLIEALRQLKPEWAELELAHRLDRDTSGCLIVAKKALFLKHVQHEFKVRSVKKHYLAIVHGCWPDSLVEVDAPLQKNQLSSGERIVRVRDSGKPCLTLFRVRQRYQQATLLEAMPETGRTHQIRVHCQYAGHPIVGDARYTRNAPNKELAKVKNLCLHASKIRFSVPDSTAAIEVAAPLPDYISSLLDRLVEK